MPPTIHFWQHRRLRKSMPLFAVSVVSIYFFMIFLTHIDVGIVGESIRYYLHLLIGQVAILLPFCGLYWLLERYIVSSKYHNDEHSVGMVVIGFVILILSTSTLFSLLYSAKRHLNLWDALLVLQNSGGFWGSFSAHVLFSGIGFWGAVLVNVFLIIFSLSLFVSVHWRLLFIATGMKVLTLGGNKLPKVIDDIDFSTIEKSPGDQIDHRQEKVKSFLIHKSNTQLTENNLAGSEPDGKAEKNSWREYCQRLWHLYGRRNKKNNLMAVHRQPILDDFICHDVKDIKPLCIETDKLNLGDVEQLGVDDVDGEKKNQKVPNRFGKNGASSGKTSTQKDKQQIIKTDSNSNNPSFNNTPRDLKTTQLPPLKLLNSTITRVNSYTDEQLNAMGVALEKNLKDFNIEVLVRAIQPGPVVTLFEIEPAPGVKVGQIVQLAKDLARSLVVASVRVVEVIPGKSYIGIEIPNNQREPVNFYEMLSADKFQKQNKPLSIALGKNIGGAPVVIDLAKTPHLLVAGTTGSGKSVGINSMILSLLYKSLPNDIRLILIDPKMLELSAYEGIAHLITPVVTDMGEATAALKWAVAEMERRYKLMSLLGVRNIIGYNEKLAQAQKEGIPIKDPMHKPTALYSLEEAEPTPELEKMPYIVIVIDEFADLIMVIGKQIEELIARIAQKARAAGIHLILATQRPSVNVITGLIKANIPTRLSFQVSTKIDSRTILDQGGAEQLLGLGDMLYLAPGQGVPLRAHGAFVSDEEVHKTVAWLKKNHHPPTYIENLQEQTEQTNLDLGIDEKVDGEDELFSMAWEVVFRTKKASISRVQRELRIGYNRAARLIEAMEQQGLLSAPDERGHREILSGKTDNA